MSTVEEYCKNLVILHKGKTILQGNLSQIKSGYGHTNLIIKTDQDISAFALEEGLQLIRERADETEYRITGDEMANSFLNKILEAGIYPVKYEITEPSLNEIFIGKVGAEE